METKKEDGKLKKDGKANLSASSQNFNEIDYNIIDLLKRNPEGLRTNIILKTLNLKSRTLYNHLERLEGLKILKNAYPIWKLKKDSEAVRFLANSQNKFKFSEKPIEVHKISFLLKLVRKPEWWDNRENRFQILKPLNPKTIKWGNSKDIQINFKQFIIGFFPDAIYFINQKEYTEIDPLLAMEQAVLDTLQALEVIENQVKFKFFPDEVPSFQIKTSHYVKIKDAFAEKCKDSGNLVKIYIKDKIRAGIDLSKPFGFETYDKDFGATDMNTYGQYVGDILNKDHFLPSEIKDLIGKNAVQIMQVSNNQLNNSKDLNLIREDLNYIAKNYASHVKLVEKASKVMDKLDKRLSTKNIKQSADSQKSIFDY